MSSPACLYKAFTFTVTFWAVGAKLKLAALGLMKEVIPLVGIVWQTSTSPWLHGGCSCAMDHAKYLTWISPFSVQMQLSSPFDVQRLSNSSETGLLFSGRTKILTQVPRTPETQLLISNHHVFLPLILSIQPNSEQLGNWGFWLQWVGFFLSFF